MNPGHVPPTVFICLAWSKLFGFTALGLAGIPASVAVVSEPLIALN